MSDRRIVVHSAGGFDALKLEDYAAPPPGPGEIRVSTEAVGVNFADVVVRMGLYDSAKKYVGWPITPGFEYAGVVKDVGAGVTRYSAGDRVFGVTRFGGYTSALTVNADFVFPTPAGLSSAQASTFPTVFLTAWYALHEVVRLRPKQKILIHSAAGGVGIAALQLAKLAGCTAIGVVSGEHKIAPALEAGAHAVIDKTRQNLWRTAEEFAPEGYQVILDPNGRETLRQSYRHLGPTGRLIVYGFHTMLTRGRGKPSFLKLAWDYLWTPRFDPIEMTNANKGVVAFNLSYLFEELELMRGAMTFLVGELERGNLRPLPITEFPLARASEAHRALQSGSTVGKLVLIP